MTRAENPDASEELVVSEAVASSELKHGLKVNKEIDEPAMKRQKSS